MGKGWELPVVAAGAWDKGTHQPGPCRKPGESAAPLLQPGEGIPQHSPSSGCRAIVCSPLEWEVKEEQQKDVWLNPVCFGASCGEMLLYGSFQSLPRSGCQQCTWDCSRNKGICLPSLRGWKNRTNIFGWKDQIFHRGKKIKVVFFLLIIFSTSRAKTSPGGVGWTELWLVLLRDARSGVTGLSVGWERGFLLPVCPELCTNPRSC